MREHQDADLRDESSSGQYGKLREQLKRALTSICPRDMAAHIDDLVQDAVLRVMNRKRQNEGDAQFNSSYIRRVAYSALVDEIRRIRRRREESVEREASAEPLRSGSPNPERMAAGREIGDAIRQCLASLLVNRRRAVTLYLQGHGVPETARLLGWTTKKAENLVFRGMADLRSCLKSKGVRP